MSIARGVNLRKCVNSESYGMICVHCGCCSEDKAIRYPARLALNERELERAIHFDNWIPGHIRLQKRNMKLNATYNRRRIAIYKRLVKSLEGKAMICEAEVAA